MTPRMILAVVILAICLSNTKAQTENTSSAPPSALFQLPYQLSASKSEGPRQCFGDPVKIRAKRTFTVQAGPSHQSRNNLVAVYIGLPTPDAAHEHVAIEEITSQKADPANIIFSPENDSLLIEYFNVPAGFEDEITLTFSLELYCRKTELSQIREQAYNKESPLYKRYTKSPTEDLDPILQKHLKRLGYNPDKSVLYNIRKIYLYIGKQLQYGHYTSDESAPEDRLEGGKAHCGIYATLFVNLCQQAGIPARRCAGFLLAEDTKKPEQTIVSAHNWAEFYLEEIGWIPVDPTMGDKADKRKSYYFGNLDNAHLCISKGGTHDRLPVWYKTSASGDLVYTDDLKQFRSDFRVTTIQGAYWVRYRWDKPIQVTVTHLYGAENMQVLSREGTFQMPER